MWWIASKAWTKWVSKDFESFGADSLLVLPCWLYGVAESGLAIGSRSAFLLWAHLAERSWSSAINPN